ncbi:hypothetical protein B0H19DRAFT_1197892 [Mycena capillaripes]|nr:hypothetical protein B0H19DRAFT_1197892 [Mycena capillaripes]
MLMSSPAQPPAGRMSQMLPSVKCSNCSFLVPLAELGEHICAPAPPLPTLNLPKTSLNLPKPSLSPGAAASLLPQRLQGLVNAPVSPGRAPAPPPSPRAPMNNAAASRNDRPRLNTSGPSFNAPSYPTRGSPRGSPLSRTGEGPPAPRSSSRDPYASGGESPVLSRPIGGFARARSGSNASSMSSPGFAAAARAAMFASSSAPAPPPAKASPPRHLDIGATIGSNTTPPPLSTSTGSSNSPGIASYPESPVSPQPFNSRSRSPPSRAPAPKAQLQSSASVSSRGSSRPSIDVVSQSSGSEYGGLAYADSTDYEDEDDDDEDLRRANELRSGLASSGLGSFRTKSPPPAVRPDPTRRAPSEERSDRRTRSDSRASLSDESDYGEATSPKRDNSARVAQALGLSQAPPSSYERFGGPGLAPSRGGHSRENSGGSAYSSRSAVAIGDSRSDGRSGSNKVEDVALSKSKSTGRDRSFSPEARRKDRARDLDDSASIRSGRSNNSPDSRATRARASPTRERSTTRDDPRRERAVRKPKVCVRCEKKIEDGKWVQVDSGGVLCEKCWKNMYLPKCRRCNLPIEKQAVSSSDGQLKGKYHRECFNCYTCHKPFPDKTFYVLDGKPLCAYHYHEANDSLCAAARCGQPIEGPCAISHAGDRYHPEHMLCEFPGAGGCKERLDEYWEIDGRMLCERHSRASRLADEEADDDAGWARSTRAMKRVTRFIDLTNGKR